MQFPVLFLSTLLTSLLPAVAEAPSKFGAGSLVPKTEPKYLSESPLPKGWPEPGPYGQVTRKDYPAYRAAVTADSKPNGGFWRLFKHIERNNIPMTSPVEMKLDDTDAKGTKMEEMAFLYQSPEVGKTGADGENVEVKDMPALSVLSYTWQGGRDSASVAKARALLDAELTKQNLKATGYRVLGYNSPFVPKSKQTFDLQALLAKK